MRDGLYAAHRGGSAHAEGQTNETTIQFTPDGRSAGRGSG
jgi:hypothetical protein